MSEVVSARQVEWRQCMKAVRECISGLGQTVTADTTTSAETSGGRKFCSTVAMAVWLTVMSGLSCAEKELWKSAE